MKKKDQEFIKYENQNLVLEMIRTNGPISRAEIAKAANMSPTTVSRIVSSLCERGMVRETNQQETGSIGRKAILLEANENSILSIGAEIDKGVIRLAVINFHGEINYFNEYDNPIYYDAEQTINQLIKLVRHFIQETQIDESKLIGIGIGVPGIIDQKYGIVMLSAQLGWRHVHAKDMIEEQVGLMTVIDNELKIRAYAESLLGETCRDESSVLVGFTNGVGSALVVNGDVFRGNMNSAGEIGHMVIDPNGLLCECGSRGCLQTYIVEKYLIHEAQKIKPIHSLDRLFECAEKREVWAINILERAALYIVITINNVVCAYNPNSVILSGHLVENYPLIQKMIDEKIDTNIWTPFKDSFKLYYSSLKEKGVVQGAGLIVQQQYVQSYKEKGSVRK
ncbi:ROK family transcriptional regulator [Scopulibacillus cellulosilyticus]|uniref:ROK family transcriptional regulator n=1 Tax=Scopulibacillus cellulosilyticus TaxID=2665665 RepID=A0ABW2PUE0_9BACL